MWVSFLAEQFCTKFGSHRSRFGELYCYRLPIDLHADTYTGCKAYRSCAVKQCLRHGRENTQVLYYTTLTSALVAYVVELDLQS